MAKTVRMPSAYTPKQLVIAHRFCTKNPTVRLIIGDGYACPEMTGRQWLLWFVTKLQEKITFHDPRTPKGRKSSDEYALELYRIGQQLKDRVVVQWVAPCLGTRVAIQIRNRLIRKGYLPEGHQALWNLNWSGD